jgi:hypothetical protein
MDAPGCAAGPLEQVRRDYPLVFKEAVEVRRLGFPPVIMPGRHSAITRQNPKLPAAILDFKFTCFISQ